MANVIDAVLVLVFSLHLLCMNVSSAGPLMCCWLDSRAARGNEEARRACRFMANASLLLFVVGMGLGLIIAAAWWSPVAWKTLLAKFGSRIVWGGWELLVYAVCAAVYCVWVAFDAGGKRRWARLVRGLIAVFAATNLLYHFPPMFVIFTQVLDTPSDGVEVVSSAEFRRLLADPEVLSKSAHFLLASVAVSAALLMWFVLGGMRKTENSPESSRLAVCGARIALAATVAQAPVGIWVFMKLPAIAQNRLLGDDLLGAILFGAGVLAAVWLMHLLASVAMGEVQRSAVTKTIVVMVVVVALMAGAMKRSAPPRNQQSFPSTDGEAEADTSNSKLKWPVTELSHDRVRSRTI